MQVYIVIEMVLLLFIGLSLVLRLVWKGPKSFLRSRNTLIVSNTTYAYTHYTQVTVAAGSGVTFYVHGSISNSEQKSTSL